MYGALAVTAQRSTKATPRRLAVSWPYPQVSRWTRSGSGAVPTGLPLFGASPTVFLHYNEGHAHGGGYPTNKDLDTGGYTAKTCEASAGTTGATAYRAEKRSCPASRGHGYIKMTTRAIGRGASPGRGAAWARRCGVFNSLYWSLQMQGGWAYLPRASGYQ